MIPGPVMAFRDHFCDQEATDIIQSSQFQTVCPAWLAFPIEAPVEAVAQFPHFLPSTFGVFLMFV
jgi:hypothetical protein